MTAILTPIKEMKLTNEFSTATKILFSYLASYATASAVIILVYLLGMFGNA